VITPWSLPFLSTIPCRMKHHNIPRTFALTVITLLASGTALGASETDERIVSTFPRTYVYKTYLKDDSVTVRSKDGVVTLTGSVADAAHKALAQETAASLPGVTRVDNQLLTKEQVAGGSADAWIGRKVSLTLLLHRNVSSGKTAVAVKDGVVTLTGEAASAGQRDLTSEYAKDVDGVKDVRNDMTVVAAADPAVRTTGEKIDDASITSQVRFALMTHRSTNALKVKVDVRNGEVGLTGIANNDAEKALVTKLVTDLQGVTSVSNQMTIGQVLTK
jgi:hyperosmotically inducible protein